MKSALFAAAAFAAAEATITTISSVPFVGEGIEVYGSTNGIAQVRETSVISGGTGGNILVESVFPSQSPATVELSMPMTHGATAVYDHIYGGIFHFACQGAAGVQAYVRNPPNPVQVHGYYQSAPGVECRSIAQAYGQINSVGTHFECIKWTDLGAPVFQGSIPLSSMAHKIVSKPAYDSPTHSYVSLGHELLVVDHSVATAPSITATLGAPQNWDIRDMIVQDNRLIIANGAYGIRVYDITNQAAISLIGDYTGFHSSPITSITIPELSGTYTGNYRVVAAAPGDRLFILDPNTFAVLEDDVQYADIEKVSANAAQMSNNNVAFTNIMYFVGIGNNVFKNLKWDSSVILPPAPGCIEGVEIAGQTISGSAVTGHSMPLSASVQLEGIPQFLFGSEMFAPTLPVAASTDITLSCCGTSACDFFITIFRCLGCPAAASDLPGILVSEKWESGSCAPKFSLNGGEELYGMATFHKQLQPGDIYTVPPTSADTQYMAIFKHASVPQPWCPSASNKFVGAQQQCACPP